MAASMNMMETEVTLIDAEENKTYTVTISIEDAERAYNDLQFAATLLQSAKLNVANNSGNTTINIENSEPGNELTDITNKDIKEQHNWTKEETLLLIDIYTTKEKEFYNGKNTVKHCWEVISKEMGKKGYNISGKKCCIKFQAMKRTYKSIKDHNNRSGNNAKRWEYFDLMDNLFNKKPWVEPLAVAGTSVDVDENDNSEDNSVKSQKQSRTKRKSMDQYMEKWLEEKALKRTATEERHKEKMEKLQKIQDLLQKIVDK